MSEQEQPISGLVAKIVSDREVILNKGAEQGVEAGMFFKIIDPETIHVTDPETGKDLGGVKRIKIVVQAIDVAPKLTLARTFRTRSVRVSGSEYSALRGTLADLMSEPKYERRVERLKLDPSAGKPMSEDESAVSVGDPFEESAADEAEDTRTVTIWE